MTTIMKGRTATAVLALGAALVTAGCAQERGAMPVQAATAAGAAQPVVVSCEPSQRAIVRPAVINGATVSQVECVSSAAMAPMATTLPAATSFAAPVQQPQYRPVTASQPVYDDLGDARVIPARTVPARQAVYDREPARSTRSVKKSAIIIGSSAGVGAGVGAAVGGKKGALIGAAIGGGGAAIWDQVTRRR
jgi:hypothetical protein